MTTSQVFGCHPGFRREACEYLNDPPLIYIGNKMSCLKMKKLERPERPRKKNVSRFELGVSKNRGTPKWMVYNGKTLLKWMIWRCHYFWKHPINLRWFFFLVFQGGAKGPKGPKKHSCQTYQRAVLVYFLGNEQH